MIKAIGFDWGGVLVKSKPIMPGVGKIVGMSPEELYPIYLQYNHLAGVHSISYEDVMVMVLEKIGQADKAPEVIQLMKELQTFDTDQEMIQLVDSLKANDYKVGLLSNNTREIGQRIKNDGLAEHFDSFLISAEIGFQKPDPKAFQVLFDELGVTPDELIFTDDSPPSLSTATEIGYHPILFTGQADLTEQLRTLGVKIN